MILGKITKEEQIEQIEEGTNLVRYTYAGPAPEVLTGESYGDSFKVTEILPDRFSIQLQPGRVSVQKMLEAVYPTTVTRDGLISEGNWYIASEQESATFIKL